MTPLYTAKATADKGRKGRAVSDDGRLDVGLSTPKALGGDDGPGTNPEQLFAAGYAACFMSAMQLVSGQTGIKLPVEARVHAEVGIGPREAGGFGLAVTLTAELPGLAEQDARTLVNETEKVCPYSNAVKGNVDVTLNVATR